MQFTVLIQEQNQQSQQLHPFPGAERQKARGHGVPSISLGVKRTFQNYLLHYPFFIRGSGQKLALGYWNTLPSAGKIKSCSLKRVQSWLLLPQERDRSMEKSYEGKLAALGRVRTATGTSRRCPLLMDCHHTAAPVPSTPPAAEGPPAPLLGMALCFHSAFDYANNHHLPLKNVINQNETTVCMRPNWWFFFFANFFKKDSRICCWVVVFLKIVTEQESTFSIYPLIFVQLYHCCLLYALDSSSFCGKERLVVVLAKSTSSSNPGPV